MSSNLDHAINNHQGHSMHIEEYSLRPIVQDHSATSVYKVPPVAMETESYRKKAQDIVYTSNNQIWNDIINEKIRSTNKNIVLDNFFIFEWFPRSPGLYFTEEGRYARDEARHRITGDKRGNFIVYNPYGKMSMLQGGVGNLRMRPIELKEGEYYFVSASSNGNCHEGVPVAIPSDLFNDNIDEIIERGAVVKNLVGKLKLMPVEYSNIYHDYRGVPKFYLQIHDIKTAVNQKNIAFEDLSVSVAASFISRYEGHRNIYATYVTFDPSIKGDIHLATKWLEEEYVSERYDGRIITDFDEVTSHFANAPFSLAKVMNLKLDQSELDILQLGHMFDRSIALQEKIKVELKVNNLYMEQIKYNITGGQIGAVGDGAQAHNFTQQQIVETDIDLNKLIEELTKLRTEAKREATTDEHEIELGKLAEATSAAKNGDKKTALEKLTAVGKWTYGIAEKIGTTLLAGYLKSQLGM